MVAQQIDRGIHGSFRVPGPKRVARHHPAYLASAFFPACYNNSSSITIYAVTFFEDQSVENVLRKRHRRAAGT